ncbi:hypothetical protein EMIT051CA3_20652 [Pseudomonas chlororaphis]
MPIAASRARQRLQSTASVAAAERQRGCDRAGRHFDKALAKPDTAFLQQGQSSLLTDPDRGLC